VGESSVRIRVSRIVDVERRREEAYMPDGGRIYKCLVAANE
jgi:hypothetical protein